MMLARSSTLNHPSGVRLRTPLLVPSFSSKGFGFNKKGKSEIKDIFLNTVEVLTDSMLVSAYDIYHGHLPKPQRFPCTPLLTFVDSGGYETGAYDDLTIIYKHPNKVTDEWKLHELREVLDSWPGRIPAVFVSFDKGTAGKGLETQIEHARKLFYKHSRQLHNFLIKPTRQSKGALINTIKATHLLLKELASFHVIGVTEKELGRNMLDRMVTVATLRRYLDEVGVSSPIQVFGALDPLSSSLYFLAGAEIFDGLTWLRYAYQRGQCIYQHNYGTVEIGIDVDDDFVKAKIASDNYYSLKKLQLALRDFVITHDYGKLPHSDFLRNAIDSLNARIGGGA